MTTLLLTEPFGASSPDAYHISLRASRAVDMDTLGPVLDGYSCHPPAKQKIVDCLNRSGRYDCFLQGSWFRYGEDNVRDELEELGIEMIVDHRPSRR